MSRRRREAGARIRSMTAAAGEVACQQSEAQAIRPLDAGWYRWRRESYCMLEESNFAKAPFPYCITRDLNNTRARRWGWSPEPSRCTAAACRPAQPPTASERNLGLPRGIGRDVAKRPNCLHRLAAMNCPIRADVLRWFFIPRTFACRGRRASPPASIHTQFTPCAKRAAAVRADCRKEASCLGEACYSATVA